MDIYKISFFIFLSSVLISCSKNNNKISFNHSNNANDIKNQKKQNEPLFNIHFDKTIGFGTTNGRVVVVGNQVVADRQNRVFIPDAKTKTIHVFDSHGNYVMHFGGKGKGPGEFLYIGDIEMDSKHLYVSGISLLRINVYSLDSLSYSHAILLKNPRGQEIGSLMDMSISPDFSVRRDGIILQQFQYASDIDIYQWENDTYYKKNVRQFYWMNQDGKIISDLLLGQKRIRWHTILFRGRRIATQFPFFGEPLIAMSDNGVIAAARTNQFLINIYNQQGNFKHSITFPFKRALLQREALIEQFDMGFEYAQLKAVKTMELPKTWPALEKIFIDDKGRLWVAAIVEDLSLYEWYVFNLKGELLARFHWPRKKTIKYVNNGYLYTFEDNKQGITYVYRYKIVITKK